MEGGNLYRNGHSQERLKMDKAILQKAS